MKKIICALIISTIMSIMPAAAMAEPTQWAISEQADEQISYESEIDYTAEIDETDVEEADQSDFDYDKQFENLCRVADEADALVESVSSLSDAEIDAIFAKLDQAYFKIEDNNIDDYETMHALITSAFK